MVVKKIILGNYERKSGLDASDKQRNFDKN